MQRERRTRADGTERSAVLEGDGRQPVVLLHGYPFDPGIFEPQMRALRRDARFVAPDLLGLGASRLGPSAAPRMDDYAADVLAWMDDAGVSRAPIVGLSMGGYVAFALWRKARERVAALVLLDTKAEADGEEAKRGRIETRDAIARGGMAAVCDGMLEKVLGQTTRGTRPDLVARIRRMILDTDPAGAMAASEALRERPDSGKDLATIDVPTVVVVGEEDVLTPPEFARSMAQRIAGARLVEVPRSGHVSSLEAPDAITDVLRDVLAAS